MNNPYGSHQIHVVGSTGQLFGANNKLWKLANGQAEPELTEYAAVDTFSAQIADFAARVRSRERPMHSAEEGRLVLDVITRAAEDAEGWQKLAKAG